MKISQYILSVATLTTLASVPQVQANTNTNIFFNASQTMTVLSSNLTTITIQSGDYRFTYSQDGYFTGGVGLTNPVGRFFSVVWPNGVQAQAYTAGPNTGQGANITLKRADGKKFDLQSFTGKILLNTAGAGGAFEITPLLNGTDATGSPFMYDCTGYGGQSFSYTTSLVGYDTYKIHMWGDFALTALMLTDTNPPPPPTPTNTITVSASPVAAGFVGGGGDYPSNSTCTVTASPNAGWGFKNWTVGGTQVSTSQNYSFTVRSNRTLVGNFVPAFNVTITTNPAFGGATTGGGIYNSNSTATVHATPAGGFRFVNWTDYGAPVSTATNFSFTITNDHVLTANFAPQVQTAIFDFDTGWPTVSAGQGMPGSQSNNLLTAYFSTLAGGWSMQTKQTSVIGVNPLFSGNFLYPSTAGSAFQIQFSEPVTDVAFDFTTGEISSEYNTAGTVRLIALTNNTPVGTNLTQGAWISGAYPEGHLSFHSATPFTTVKIDEAPIGLSSALLFADNFIAQRVATPPATNAVISVTASPAAGGSVSGGGTYATGAVVTVRATVNPGYAFVNWTDGGIAVSTATNYSFTASVNRSLTANFITFTPPLAFGGTFYQLTGQPLVINISDLMWNDYDPDGDPVYFSGTSATTAHGLVITNDGVQIFVPANSVADSFTYTINDGNGGTASSTGNISIITNVTSQALALDLVSNPGMATVNFTGVPWYFYTAERATNILFTAGVRTWSVQAGPDGSIYLWDDFTDLGGQPAQSFYRLAFP